MILVDCADNFGGLLDTDFRTDPFKGRDPDEGPSSLPRHHTSN